MNSKKFSEAMSELDSKYIDEAIHYKKKSSKKHNWTKWGSLAACLCLALGAAFTVPKLMQPSDIGDIGTPQPSNPIISPIQEEPHKQQTDNSVIDETMTLEEAQLSEPFGGYMLSEAPSGFTVETIRRYQDETANYLSGLWTKGEGSFDEISWRVSSYDDTMENRVTSVDDTQNYDLSLYPIPLADSVPEELFEVVDHPIFNIDELTLEAVSRRAYTINESSDTDAIRMTFGVRYGDIVVDVTTKGVSPEWIYEQLIELKDVGSNTQDMAAKRAAQNVIVDETMTLEEAQLSEPFGGYMLSEAPSGFTSDIIRRYQDETVNYLSGFWTKGEDSFDEISWRVSSYDATKENRVTSVDDTKNYDLSLYSFPLADSVPEELFEIVDHPIFNMDELTLEAINRRAYSINESNGTSAIRMTFGVRYGDVVVEVTTKGVSAQWIYDQLVNVYHDKSCINFRSSN